MHLRRNQQFFLLVFAQLMLTAAGLAVAAKPVSPSPAAVAPAAGSDARPHNYRDRNFDYFVSGNPTLPRAVHTEAGLALMGGGGRLDAAFRFIATHAGGGHIVILRAVSDDSFDADDGDYGIQFAHQWGPVVSAETIVFHNRDAAFDAHVIAALRGADGIFLAGGDQSNYIRYWKGTPVQEALNAHVRNRPIGGSSAGLAILGRYSYTALDGGSMESRVALADPYDSGITLENDFLHCPWLDNVITDTHFSARSRLGRLITFVARLNQDQVSHDQTPAKIFGIGIDEKTALLVGADGIGRIAPGSAGSAWLVMSQSPVTTVQRGLPLSIKDIHLLRLDAAASIDLKSREVLHPAAEAKISIEQGKLTRESIATPIIMRAVTPPDES